MTLQHNESRTETWCLIGDPGSVEARFGLRDCSPTGIGGNRCEYVIPPWARDERGRIRAGALMVLADHILGELPYIRRPPRTWSLTAELTVDIVGDLCGIDRLAASAQEISHGSESFVQYRITGPDDVLLAVGSARCVHVRATANDPEADTSAKPPTRNRSSKIDVVLGLTSARLEEGRQLTLATPDDWNNGFGIMHGGVSACVNELAAAATFQAQNADLETAQIHTSYLRPVVGGAPYRARARAYHIGRSSAVVEVLGYSGADELCTVSTVTARRPVRLG